MFADDVSVLGGIFTLSVRHGGGGAVFAQNKAYYAALGTPMTDFKGFECAVAPAHLRQLSLPPKNTHHVLVLVLLIVIN